MMWITPIVSHSIWVMIAEVDWLIKIFSERNEWIHADVGGQPLVDLASYSVFFTNLLNGNDVH